MDGQSILLGFKVILTIIFLFLYFSYIFAAWVSAEDIEWGLWQWCYKKDVLAALKTEDNTTEECHSIAPGDSPALTGGIALILVALHYRDDDRWKHSKPVLNWAFWVNTAVITCEFLLCCCMSCGWACQAIRQRILSAGSPPRPRPRRRLSTVSSISIDNGRRMTIFHTGSVSAGQELPCSWDHRPAQFPQTQFPESSVVTPESSTSHSGVLGSHSRIFGGHSRVSGGNFGISGGHSTASGGHSTASGGQSKVSGGYSKIWWSSHNLQWSLQNPMVTPQPPVVTPESLVVTPRPYHGASQVSDHQNQRDSSRGQPFGQVGQVGACVPLEAAGLQWGRLPIDRDVGVLQVKDPPTGRLVFRLSPTPPAHGRPVSASQVISSAGLIGVLD